MFAPWAPVLLDAAGVHPGDQVLDVACGTGVVTRLAAERVGSTGRAVGLDCNAAMLVVAR
jgi:ubiquinone/menaquinone biosynthesis C-methylase UbiE